MTFDLEREIARANADYFAGQRADIPLGRDEIPVSIRADTERDEEPPDEDTSDWPDDHKLDDPRRGQAKDINRKGIL